ncbi:NAD-dependent epimerase/dehydratase family protein, partial [Patescibacteria group bacterium]
ANVVAVDNLSTGSRENIARLEGRLGLTFKLADVNRFDELASVFGDHRIDYVFHYAALVGVKNVIERPLEVFKDIDGIKFLLALAHAHRVKKVVFASSSEAYGEPVELPEREEGRLNVNAADPYGLTKLVGENMVRNYWKRYGLPGTSLRFFNVYGPRQQSSAYGFVVGIFIKKILAGEPVTIYGNGTQTRDFIFIDDNIEAAIRALFAEQANGQAINVGSGRQTTILELGERISRLGGREFNPVFLPEREVEVRYRCPDITKMQNLLGFSPQTSLDEGLSKTFDWYKLVNSK